MNLCIAAINSMTYAVKAQKVLRAKNIAADIIKIDPTLTKRGCAWGVQFECFRTDDVLRFLDSRNIPYGEILGAWG